MLGISDISGQTHDFMDKKDGRKLKGGKAYEKGKMNDLLHTK